MWRAIGVVGHADHDGVGLPLLLGGYAIETGIAFGMDRALRLGCTHKPVTHCYAGTFQAEIKSNKGRECRGDRHCDLAHACPTC